MLEGKHVEVGAKVIENIRKGKGDHRSFHNISERMGPRHCGKINDKINAISTLCLTESFCMY